ncbi:MAG: hypothetical protein RMK29_02680 [Myxococcales bacterium]|nr:hypothetical protein [Myxococcota bacterium]MDW8280587.1 hypothetical protein [Myxococcales bacterium]
MRAFVCPRLPGFCFAETLSGHVFLQGQRRAMECRLRAEAQDIMDHLRTGRTAIAGAVDIEGVCHRAPLAGTLWIHLPRRIRYEFSFRTDDGRSLRFVGQKDIRLVHPLRTLTTLPGEVHDNGRTIGLARLHFRWRTLPAFLGSFRPLF